MTMHDRHKEWIAARGISSDLAARLGLFTKRDAGGAWLAIPYVEHGRVVNHKYRLTGEKRHRMDAGAPLSLWNHDVLLEESDQPLIITEGEWDALAAMSAGFGRTVSVPNGAPAEETDAPEDSTRYQFLFRSRPLLDRVGRFILAVDGDAPGRALAADLARALGPERCMFLRYPDGCKDLNEVLLAHGAAGVAALIADARPYPVRGLYRLSDFPDPPALRSVPVGVAGLDDHFQLTPGSFTVIAGWAGHGKTSLLMAMLANVMKAGIAMAIGSFETMPRPILESRMRAAIYQCHGDDPRAHRFGPADDLMAEKLSIIAHSPVDDETELTLDYIIELARIAVIRDGIRLLLLDPWNEIEHQRGPNETETDYTSRAIRELKRFAKNYDCAVWLVAHPRKPASDGNPRPPSLYDIAGSAHFANKADYGLVIHRDDLAGSRIMVKVVKVRMGLPGRVGMVELDFDERRSSYAPSHAPGCSANQAPARPDRRRIASGRA
ncbi:bifunctional DNA primase/helicase [Sphingomonas oleivorans]|nr:bifunctional DNA primase/helicase [Sphingomonas oleivorans]